MVDLRIKIIFCNTFITANKPLLCTVFRRNYYLLTIIIKSVQGVTEVNLRATEVCACSEERTTVLGRYSAQDEVSAGLP